MADPSTPIGEAPHEPVEVFYSYAHRDMDFVSELEEHLSALKRRGLVTTWYDKQLGAGEQWRERIHERLTRADIILLLVSASFLNSDFINEVELARALERHRRGEARVVPVIVRDCDWQDPPLGELQAIPKGGVPLNKWRPPDDGYADAARHIRALVQEVAAAKQRHAAASPHPARRTVFQHVPRRNLSFTGRERLLDALRQSLTTQPRRPAAVALVGMGGVGKTAIATEYAHRFADAYPLVWWVRAEDANATAADLASLAAYVGVLDTSPPSLERARPDAPASGGSPAGSAAASGLLADRSAAVAAALRWLGSTPDWLLVFDNAREPNSLLDYLPQAGTGHVLLTSRSPEWSAVAERLNVAVLSPEEGARFLAGRTTLDAGDMGAAEQLAELLGGLPLALEQAAGFMETTGMPILEYLEVIRDAARSDEGEPLLARVAATLTPSFDAIGRDSPAADILRFCAWMGPNDIPKEAISGGHAHLPDALGARVTSRVGLAELIGELRRYSLIALRGDGLSVHRLVQRVVRQELSTDARREWVGRVLRALASRLPEDVEEPEYWPVYERYLAHVLAAAEHAQALEVELELTATLLSRLGDYQSERARPLEARQVLERALGLAQSAVGPNAALVADIHLSIGNAAESLADLRTAQVKYEAALELNRKLDRPGDVATCLNNLGFLAEQRRLLPEAQARYAEALEIERGLGHEVEVANIRLNLGSISEALGKYAEAQGEYEEALRIYKAQRRPNGADMAIALAALGDLFIETGDIPAARRALERALELDTRWYDSAHPAVAVDYAELGRACLEGGDLPAAEANAEHALAIQTKVYQNLRHPEVARTYFLLGRIREAQGMFDEALAMFQRALEHDEENDLEKAADLTEIGRMLVALGRPKEAVARYQHAHRLYRDVRGLERELEDVSKLLREISPESNLDPPD